MTDQEESVVKQGALIFFRRVPAAVQTMPTSHLLSTFFDVKLALMEAHNDTALLEEDDDLRAIYDAMLSAGQALMAEIDRRFPIPEST